jgi:hypothetical protein
LSWERRNNAEIKEAEAAARGDGAKDSVEWQANPHHGPESKMRNGASKAPHVGSQTMELQLQVRAPGEGHVSTVL